MKILMLSDINSAHTQQWANGLAANGLQIGIFSLRKDRGLWPDRHPSVSILYAEDQSRNPKLGILNNYDLFTYTPKLKEIIDRFQPDIVHAHGVGNHGLVAARLGFQPLVLSAWGSDIMSHPKKSFLHQFFVKYALRKASVILATSKHLARETRLYTSQNVTVTPFGIDLQRFVKRHSKKLFAPHQIVLGSVKGLKKIYNHDWSLSYFASLVRRFPDLPLYFLMVGDGPERKRLEELTVELGIEKRVTFAGAISHQQVPQYLCEIDVLLNLSARESFGVAVLEASAMQIPVVAARVGGLPEVIEEEVTGFLVNTTEEAAVLVRLEQLILQPALREKMGRQGRIFVSENYDQKKCIQQMIQIYKDILS